jgi:drug/metabolite transporter (DMT)-like permease
VKRNGLGVSSLLVVTIAWGASFVAMKPAMDKSPVFDFLAIRFTIAAILMVIAKPKVLKALKGKTLLYGIILGVILGFSYITQTIGLTLSTAAITSFVTGLYVILTPLLVWVIFKRKPRGIVAIGAILATVGLGFITIKDASFDFGQIWTILCALGFAAHIVGLGKWSPGKDVYALTVIQLLTVAVVSWIGAAPDGIQQPVDGEVWFAILFTAVFATALAFFIQTWAQSIMDASRVAIILTMEVVFAALTSVAVGQEVLSVQVIFGGLLMLAAMLLIEWPRKDSTPEEVIYEPMAH